MTADTIIKFQDQGAVCTSGGHQCNAIGSIVAKYMSNLDMDMLGALQSVKSERAAQTALAGFKDVKLAQSETKQAVQDVRPAGGLQV